MRFLAVLRSISDLFRLMLVMLFASPVLAAGITDSFYGEKEDGYWWYKDPVEQKPIELPKKKEEPKKVDEKEKRERTPFTLEWLRKNFDKIKEDAIENPDDKDKVRAYLYAVRVVMDKAQNFAESAHEVARMDPYLDNSSRVPISSAALRETLQLKEEAKKDIIKMASQKAGLWFFFDTRCKYCMYQYRILSYFQQQHPTVKIRNVSLDGKAFPGMKDVYRDQGQAKRLNLKITPAVVFVSPPANLSVIALGMNTVDEIEQKFVMASRHHKLVSDDLLKQHDYQKRGVLESKDMKDGIENLDADNPKEWVKFLQDKIEGRY